MSVSESWNRIATWASANLPPNVFRLSPGATEQEIADLEALVGSPLPEDVRESYRIHNGTDETVFPCYWSDGELLPQEYGELVTLKVMGEMFELHRKIEHNNEKAEILTPEIKPVQWSSRRLVLTNDASDSGLRVDLDPAEAGTIGQIIRHDRSFGPVKVVAPSWEALLQRIADDADAGLFAYSEDLLGVVRIHLEQKCGPEAMIGPSGEIWPRVRCSTWLQQPIW
jgi:cell wall assembly regulator SMI1